MANIVYDLGSRIDITKLRLVKLRVVPQGSSALVIRNSEDTEDRIVLQEDGMIRNINWDIFTDIAARSSARIKTPPSSDNYIAFASHDGDGFRDVLKLIGGQAEIYSWDGSALQLVARTSAGYFELLRFKLQGDLNLGVDKALSLVGSSPSSTELLRVRVEGDSEDRFAVMPDGKLLWGDGSAKDISMYRVGSGILETDAVFRAKILRSNRGSLPSAVLTETGDVELQPLDADSENTLRDSPSLVLKSKYWNGSQSVERVAKILHRMLDTSPKSEIALQIDGEDYLKIGEVIDVFRDVDLHNRTLKGVDRYFINDTGSWSEGYLLSNAETVLGGLALPSDEFRKIVALYSNETDTPVSIVTPDSGGAKKERLRVESGDDDTQILYSHDNMNTKINLAEKLIRYDDTHVSFTNTSSETIKSFRFYRRGWKYLKLLLSVWGNGSNTVNVEITIDGNTVDSFSTNASSETMFERVIDISGLADNALHTVEIKMYVNSGTGYTQFLEVWVW